METKMEAKCIRKCKPKSQNTPNTNQTEIDKIRTWQSNKLCPSALSVNTNNTVLNIVGIKIKLYVDIIKMIAFCTNVAPTFL